MTTAESNNRPQSNLALLIGIVDRPRQTLSAVVAHPRWRWVTPVLLCAAALTVFVVVAAPYLAEQAQQQSATLIDRMGAQLDDLPSADRAQMEAQIMRFSSPSFVAGAALAGGLLGLVLSWLSGSFILFFGLLVAGRPVQFAAVWAGIAWTWLPFALRDLVAAGWTAFAQQLPINPGLSYFFSRGDPVADAGSVLWRLASLIDVFAFWHLVLVYFLITVLNPRRKAAGLLVLYTALSVALRMAPVLAASARSGW